MYFHCLCTKNLKYLFAFKLNFFQKIIIRANKFYSFAERFNQIAPQEGVVLVLNLMLCKLIKKNILHILYLGKIHSVFQI